MNIKPILIATAVALTSINAYAAWCDVKYDCGMGDGIEYLEDVDRPSGSSFTPVSPDTAGCSNPGYTFIGWAVSPYTGNGSDMNDLSSYEPMAYPGQTYNLNFAINGDTCNGEQHSSSNSTGLEMRFTAQWIAQPTFSATDIITPTSKSYTDSKMNSKQPAFSGLGANKLMTYGTTDGAVGSRDIVTELGTSTTATTVPTVGAINGGFNTKQYKLNGNAGWVATNTGINGLVGQKPIYDATNNYNTALVDAQTLNNAVINAVNSELIQVDETGTASSSGTLWKLNDAANLTLLNTRDALDVSSLNTATNGTSSCKRRLNGNSDSNGTCSASTLATLGATGSKSGLWGVVFPYGDIVGKSVCSSQSGTSATVATAEQNKVLNTEFITQTGNGNLAIDQQHCWCKMDSLNGEDVAASSWVSMGPAIGSEGCASNCTSWCAWHVQQGDGPEFREAVFGAVVQ